MERTASQTERVRQRPFISFAITVCNEHAELDRLLSILYDTNKNGSTEIVVLTDSDNTTDVVYDILNEYREHGGMRYYSHSLNMNFANHKNFLNSLCDGEWILQLDADEFPSETLLMNLVVILEANDGVDAIWVPRVNTVKGLTDEDVRKWGWQVNERGWINFPDYQMRLFRNRPEIKWTKPVHEQLVGYSTWANLPANEVYALYHPKEIERQRKQNEFYDTIA